MLAFDNMGLGGTTVRDAVQLLLSQRAQKQARVSTTRAYRRLKNMKENISKADLYRHARLSVAPMMDLGAR